MVHGLDHRIPWRLPRPAAGTARTPTEGGPMNHSSTPEPSPQIAGHEVHGHHEHAWRLANGDFEDTSVREFSCDHCSRVWFS